MVPSFEEDYDSDGWVIEHAIQFVLRRQTFTCRTFTLAGRVALQAKMDEGLAELEFFEVVLPPDAFAVFESMANDPERPVATTTIRELSSYIIRQISGADDPKDTDSSTTAP